MSQEAILSLDDGEDDGVKFVTLICEGKHFQVPIQLIKYSDLLQTSFESDPEEHILPLPSSQKLISLPLLEWIFVTYLPKFQNRPSLPIVPAKKTPDFHPLNKCSISYELLDNFYQQNGMLGLRDLSLTSNYFGITWLTNCIADKVASVLSNLTMEQKIAALKYPKKSTCRETPKVPFG
jgi:hypothetical protein